MPGRRATPSRPSTASCRSSRNRGSRPTPARNSISSRRHPSEPAATRERTSTGKRGPPSNPAATRGGAAPAPPYRLLLNVGSELVAEDFVDQLRAQEIRRDHSGQGRQFPHVASDHIPRLDHPPQQ